MIWVYLDPGTGSFLIQLLFSCAICGIPAAILTSSLAFFRNRRKRLQTDEQNK